MIETSGHDHAREWLTSPVENGLLDYDELWEQARNALLAVLDECDHADARIMLRGTMTSADVRDAINKALGIDDE